VAPPAVNALSWGRFALVALVALVVQVAILDQIELIGAHPDVMIVLVGAAGAIGGPVRGAMLGFVLGLVADLVLPTPYGLSSLTFVLVGFAAGLVRSLPGDRDGRSAQAVTTVAAAALGTMLYAAIGELVGQSGMLSREAVFAMLIVTLGAIVIAVPADAAIRWVLSGADRAVSGHSMPAGGSATR
jgi:rod shape-determining protein MreD